MADWDEGNRVLSSLLAAYPEARLIRWRQPPIAIPTGSPRITGSYHTVHPTPVVASRARVRTYLFDDPSFAGLELGYFDRAVGAP